MNPDWAEKAAKKIDLLAFDKDCKELKPVSFKSVESAHKIISFIKRDIQDIKISVNGSSGLEIELKLNDKHISFLIYNNGTVEFNVFKENAQIGGGAINQITENAIEMALSTGEN